jgi:hypothetical protein
MKERRKAARSRAVRSGKIALGNFSAAIDCKVRDFSSEGACLDITNSFDIPSNFDLVLDGKLRSCRMVWCSEKRIGVVFESK